MFISIAAVSNKGNVREKNQDNFYIASEYVSLDRMDEPPQITKMLVDHDSAVIAAVCDGMGGGTNGEYASHKVVSDLNNALKNLNPIQDEDKVTEKLRGISQKIEAFALESQSRLVGTTIVMAAFLDGRMRICNVGDSRAYMLREQKLCQLSTDHSEVQRMLNMGLLTKKTAASHPRKNVITQYMGMPSDEMLISPSFSEVVLLREGDRILLCSDGISDMMDDETIGLLLRKMTTAEKTAEALVDAALQRGGNDNATALVAFVGNTPKD